MRRIVSSVAVVALAGALLVAAPTTAVARSGVPVCEVVTMPLPPGATGGTVTDLERVRGQGTVYAGAVTTLQANGSALEQPVVWYGLHRQPQPVGPSGMVEGAVRELRRTGMISGQSVDAQRREYAWVQHLRSGRITIVETGTTERFTVHRINDRGAVAGSVWTSDFDLEARAWWPRIDRPGRVLQDDGANAQANDITNDRRIAGAIEVGDFRYQAVIWDAAGRPTRLASNPGALTNDTAWFINERGQAAGHAAWGDNFTGHLEAARWRSPSQLESLGLVPDGGYSAALGQAEGGWVVGVAEHWSPDDPNPELGPISHSVLWTDGTRHARVLPSPHAIANGIGDWRQWQGYGAYAAHTGLDQVGGSAQSASPDRWQDPVVYRNASRCGERVATTHTPYWLEPAAGDPAARSALPRPEAYDPAAVLERLTERR